MLVLLIHHLLKLMLMSVIFKVVEKEALSYTSLAKGGDRITNPMILCSKSPVGN